MDMKTVRVVAAVIYDDHKILATQRGYGDYKDGWEFPGGKIEPGETSRAALVREIKEELGAVVEPGKLISTIEYDYPDFHLSMDCFWCRLVSGRPVLREHEAVKWLTFAELDSVDWLPADLTLLPMIREEYYLTDGE